MKKLLILFFIMSLPAIGWTAGGSSVELREARNDLNDIESLRRGAKLFEARCATCHTSKYIRYKAIADGLEWSEGDIDSAMIKGRAKFRDHVVGGMTEEAAMAAYGVLPPDLTLTAKVKGTDWLFTYLQGYYEDESGKIDNYVFPGVSMPNPFAGEQGIRKARYDEHGKIIGTVSDAKFFATKEAKAKQAQRDEKQEIMIRDVVNYMEFMSEPLKTYRYELGVKVLVFLFILFIFAYLLKREYWRDIKH